MSAEMRVKAMVRWRCMVRRCTNPADRKWSNYGGRGITVCDRWLHSFDEFYADVGDPPSPGLSIDRIDNDGNYEPGNVRWATAKEQAWNQRNPAGLRSHCPQGHPYDDENTYRLPGKTSRGCRTCSRASCRASYRRKRIAAGKQGRTNGAYNLDVDVCRYGHPLTGENLRPSSTGVRDCRACRRGGRIGEPLSRPERLRLTAEMRAATS